MSVVKEPSATGMAARTSVILFLFVIIFTAILAGAYGLTASTIRESAAEEKMRSIREVLPSSLYDNDLLADSVELPPTSELGLEDPSSLYRARLGGKPSAVVFEAVAPDGYSGRIRLLVAVQADGRLAGVRVTQHKETPGLGDYIDPRKDKNKERPWITQFNGLSFVSLPEREWRGKKDGGHFDSNAGATVTPRAVVKAVKKAVLFVDANRDRLFASNPESSARKEATR
ncbi:MAG TPA: electron transport complex subunit RsxG [Rhodocyclaceae bacterium]|nr:electron transport complex subunit RsxG [Rhodocyclaceae bacterium]HNP04722.1 electron transport complex subunit RsxG [Rhodocyclaceae bacterium]